MKVVKLLFTALLVISGFKGQTQPQVWGITEYGGNLNSAGTLFSMALNGSYHEVKKNFLCSNTSGDNLVYLTKDSTGIYYGVSKFGGTYNYGLIFKYNPVDSGFQSLYEFHGDLDGRNPASTMVIAPNGKLYGTCYGGGDFNSGCIFELDPATLAFQVVHSFKWNNHGFAPSGSLVLTPGGKIYGTASTAYFAFNYSDNTFQSWPVFLLGSGTGQFRDNRMIYASNGIIYGTTPDSGPSHHGTLFQIEPGSGTYTVLKNFSGTTTGENPGSQLAEGPGGKIYGVSSGSTFPAGGLFEWDPLTNTFSNKINFNSVTTGKNPNGSFIYASDGFFYGFCSIGGTGGIGTFYKYDLSSNSLVYTRSLDPLINEGTSPFLQEDSINHVFGLNFDAVFQDGFYVSFNPSTSILSFTKQPLLASDGTHPQEIIRASDGNIYGTTVLGGLHGGGTLFKVTPSTGTYIKLVDFKHETTGSSLMGPIMQADNGKIYGVTRYGGAYNGGTLYEYDILSDTLIIKYNFNTGSGKNPYTGVAQAANGKLYGYSSSGGSGNLGTIFSFDLTLNSFSKLLDVSFSELSQYGFIQNPGGYLITITNGSNIISEFDTVSNSLLYRYPFPAGTTTRPICADDGNLYGLFTPSSAPLQLFKYEPYSANFHISMNLPPSPIEGYGIQKLNAALSNGKFLCYGNGINDSVFVETDSVFAIYYTPSSNAFFEIDTLTSTVTKIQEITGINGIIPVSNLIETCTPFMFDSTASSVYLCSNGGNGDLAVPDYDLVSYHWYYTGTNVGYDPTGSDINYTYSSASTPGNFIVTASSPCSTNDTISVIPVSLASSPVITSLSDIITCSYNSVVLTSPADSLIYTWSEGVSSGVPFYASITSDYTLTGIDPVTGCDDSDTVTVFVTTVNTSVTNIDPTLTASATPATYQWIDCNAGFSPLTGQTNQSYTASGNGNYAVIITQDGCTDTSACYSIISTGISEATNGNIMVYPNPVGNELNIVLNNTTPADITLTDMTGQVVLHQTSNGQTIKLQTNYLKAGVYCLTINIGNNAIMTKVVKD